MGRQLLGPVDLGDLEPLVAAAGVVGSLLWLALVAFVYALRSPRRPDPAVDDGTATSIRAFRVNERQFAGLRQGQVVTLATTPRLGRVRWIVRESGAD